MNWLAFYSVIEVISVVAARYLSIGPWISVGSAGVVLGTSGTFALVLLCLVLSNQQ